MPRERCIACGSERVERFGELNLRAARYLSTFLREAMAEAPPAIALQRCAGCLTIMLAAPLPEEVYRAWYADGRYMFLRGVGYGDADEEADRHGRGAVSWLASDVGGGVHQVLDVGCGRGFFLRACADAGWECAGCEIKAEYAQEARERSGARVWQGSFLDYPIGSQYDLVTFWDVFEHFPDASALLQKVRETLGPGGHVVMEIPNCRSLYARLLGRRWWFGAEHCVYYSAAGIRALLERNGFGVVSIKSDNVNLLSREGLARLGFFGQDAVWGRVSEKTGQRTRVTNRSDASHEAWLSSLDRSLNGWFNARLMGDQLRVLAEMIS